MHSSVSLSLLFIPASMFFILVTEFFISDWVFFIFSSSLLNSQFVHLFFSLIQLAFLLLVF